MITFVHPEFFYLMLPVLIILFYFLLTGKEEQHKYFSEEVLDRLQVSRQTLTMRTRNALFFVMFLLLITAMAQPVIENGKVKVKAKSADIMIAIDISDSMLATDVFPTRLDAAKKKVLDLLDGAPNERLGVMAFAKDAYLVSPLSFDHRAVRFLLKQLHTDFITEKGTDFLGLLSAASDTLKSNENRYLLLLSDGGDQEDFSKEIDYAKEKGIKVFVLALGSETGAPIKHADGSFVKYKGKIIISKRNDAVKELAFKTGGAYVEAVTSSEDISAVLHEIQAKTIRKELKEEEVVLYIALFYYPLGLALFILLLATSSMSKRQSVLVPHLFILAFLLWHPNSAHAGLLDFQQLEDAKKAYEEGDYYKSYGLYQEYSKKHPSNDVFYNMGNSLYKVKHFDKAVESYKKVHYPDKQKQAQVLFNIGNSYWSMDKLEKARDAFKKAEELADDKETTESRKRVEALLKQQKKQQQQQNNDQNNKPKEGEDSNSSKDQQEQQSQDQQNKDQEGQQDQQNKDQQPNDQNGEQDKDSDQKNDQKSQQDKQNKQDKKEKQDESENKDSDKDKQGEQPQEQQQSDAQKEQKSGLKSDQNESSDPKTAAQAAAEAQDGVMSEREAQKWLKLLEQNQVGHLYQLDKPNTPQERDLNEKPW